MVMQYFPFDAYTIRLLTIERPSTELRTLLEQNNYVFLKDLAWWGETLWAHSSTGFTPTHPQVLQIPSDTKN